MSSFPDGVRKVISFAKKADGWARKVTGDGAADVPRAVKPQKREQSDIVSRFKSGVEQAVAKKSTANGKEAEDDAEDDEEDSEEDVSSDPDEAEGVWTEEDWTGEAAWEAEEQPKKKKKHKSAEAQFGDDGWYGHGAWGEDAWGKEAWGEESWSEAASESWGWEAASSGSADEDAWVGGIVAVKARLKREKEEKKAQILKEKEEQEAKEERRKQKVAARRISNLGIDLDQSYSGVVRKRNLKTGDLYIDCEHVTQVFKRPPMIAAADNRMGARVGSVVIFKLKVLDGKTPYARDVVLNGFEEVEGAESMSSESSDDDKPAKGKGKAKSPASGKQPVASSQTAKGSVLKGKGVAGTPPAKGPILKGKGVPGKPGFGKPTAKGPVLKGKGVPGKPGAMGGKSSGIPPGGKMGGSKAGGKPGFGGAKAFGKSMGKRA